MITYDSLNRHFLSAYGCDWVKTPNFDRLVKKAVTFDTCYVGSLPCMPARRELHTGRYNFLHRNWGPLEPFDDSMPQILRDNGIHSHLSSDHMHYWEDGGCTYHTRYSSWECHRGQEGDPWKPVLEDIELPKHLGQMNRQEMANRRYMQMESDQPQAKTFSNGLEFLDTNHKADNWFLHIETFDPHEPFYTMPEYQELYEKDYVGPHFDWPCYNPVTAEEKPYVEHVRKMYAALISMCDKYLGLVLDKMDEYGLWEDTMLIVNTDHGFFLGEHDWWAKSNQINLMEEVAHTPLFIYDPRSKKTGRCSQLVQTIDLAPTILDFFELSIPKDMLGKPLKDTIAKNAPVRETGIYGVHGAPIACTNGKATLILAPVKGNEPLYNYTLMPTHMHTMFALEELNDLSLSEPFSFTKGCRLLKTPGGFDFYSGKPLSESASASFFNLEGHKTLLYDLENDPHQMNPVTDPELEAYFCQEIRKHFQQNDAPAEQYLRMGLKP